LAEEPASDALESFDRIPYIAASVPFEAIIPVPTRLFPGRIARRLACSLASLNPVGVF
jgi:hypothetical protein